MAWNLTNKNWEKSWGKHAWEGLGSSSHKWDNSSSIDGWGTFWKYRKTSEWNQYEGTASDNWHNEG
eukprot:1275500-Karenia_brevis.AAC.1